MIPHKDWKWWGKPGHFICANWCRFFLCTEIGNYLISTIGEYVHPRHAQGSEIEEQAWLESNWPGEDIGAGRKYETMVFRIKGYCERKDCNCGQPIHKGEEAAFQGYNDRKSATAGHRELCEKWAEKQSPKEVSESD